MGIKLGLEEHRLRMIQNGVLKKSFGPKNEEVTEHWRKLRKRKLHNEEVHDYTPHQILFR
jgi:hypothetical protein